MSMRREHRQLLKASELAFKNIVVLLLSVLIGVGADNYFKTKPLWVIVSSVLSLAYVVCSIFLLGSKEK